jgi:hypothetical protein
MGALTRVGCVMLVSLACGLSSAQSPDDLAKAKVHFDAGRALFALGNYPEAAREFQAGYDLAPRPRFLLNLGHAYRKMGDLARAKAAYVQFLSLVPADDPDRPEAATHLGEIEAHLTTPTPPPPLPPPVEKPPDKPPEPAPRVTVVATPAPPATSTARSRFRRWAWTIPVGAVVLTGVVVGIYFGATRSSTFECPPGALGCFPVP